MKKLMLLMYNNLKGNKVCKSFNFGFILTIFNVSNILRLIKIYT